MREHRSGLIPSFTLCSGGWDRSVMRRHLPVSWPFGITPKRLTWRGVGSSPGVNGPSILPKARSFLMYADATSGWSWAECMFLTADFSGAFRWNPIRKPVVRP